MKTLPTLRKLQVICAVIAMALAGGGCTVLEPVPDQTRFYSLVPASDGGQTAAVAPQDTPTIGVRITSVAQHLRRTAIAVREGEHEMRFEGRHRWAEAPDAAVGHMLAAGLQRIAGPRMHVFVAPVLRAARPDVLVEIDLLACEGRRGSGSAAVLAAEWRVFKGREDRPAVSGRFRVEKPGWDGGDFGGLASRLALCVEDLAQAVGGPAMQVAMEQGGAVAGDRTRGQQQPPLPADGELP